MDPLELLQMVNEALRAGVPRSEINARMNEVTGGRYRTVQDVSEAAGAAMRDQSGETVEDAALRRTAERGGSGAGDFLRAAAQGATFGFADEIAGLGGGVAAAGRAALSGEDVGEAFSAGREETTEASRQRMEDMRTLNPGSTMAAEAAGGVALGAGGLLAKTGLGAPVRSMAGPVQAGGLLGRARSAVEGSRAGSALLNRGTSLQRTLRGPTRLTPTRQFGRAAIRSSAAGAAGGAAYGAGEGEGGVGDRAGSAAMGGILGGALGGIGGGLLAVPGVARDTMFRTANLHRTVADDAQRLSGLGQRSIIDITDASRDKQAQARVLFNQLDSGGEVMPATIDDLVRKDTTLKRELRRLKGVAPEIQAGDAPISFTQADDIAKNLKERADFFRTGGSQSRPGRADEVREAASAFEKLDSAMREALEPYPEAKRLWAEGNTEMRALVEGRKLMGQNAVDAELALRDLPETVGIPQELEGEARRQYAHHLRQIAQEGMMTDFLADIMQQKGSGFRASARGQRIVTADDELWNRLAHMFPDEESAQQFRALAENEGLSVTAADKLKTLFKAAAFFGIGSSVVADLAG